MILTEDESPGLREKCQLFEVTDGADAEPEQL